MEKKKTNKYKLTIRYYIPTSDDEETGYYEKKVVIRHLTDVELEDYLEDNHVYDFEKLT